MSYEKYCESINKFKHIKIRIRCDCGRSRGCADIFFSEEPQKFCCDMCAEREVETYFCGQCLSSYPSNIVKKFARCPKCVQCPACFSILDKILFTNSNEYLFQCPNCFWSSDAVDLKGRSANGLVEELVKREAERLKAADTKVFNLIKQYKLDDEEVRQPPNRFMFLSTLKKRRKKNKIRVSEEHVEQVDRRLKSGLRQLEARLIAKHERDHTLNIDHSNIDQFEAKPLDIKFVKELNIKGITTLHHRVNDTSRQPQRANELWPQRVRLMTKEAFRCPYTQKFVYKPTIGARHHTFEVKSMAMDVFPQVRVRMLQAPQLTMNQENKILLLLSNRIDGKVHIDINAVQDDEFHSCDVIGLPTTVVLEPLDDARLSETQLVKGTVEMSSPGAIAFMENHHVAVNLVVEPFNPGVAMFSLEFQISGEANEGQLKISRSYTMDFEMGQVKMPSRTRPPPRSPTSMSSTSDVTEEAPTKPSEEPPKPAPPAVSKAEDLSMATGQAARDA